MQLMKKPNALHEKDCPCEMCHGGKMMAQGGKVNSEQPKMEISEANPDDEIQDMLGQEMMSAIESKDYKKIMQSIEATVLSCMNKDKEQI